MKNTFILFLLLTFASSCSIFEGPNYKHSKDKISLWRNLDNFNKHIVVVLKNSGDYELRIPLIYLTNYINYSREEDLINYLHLVENLMESQKNDSYYPNMSIYFNDSKMDIVKMFKSGEYFIYDTKNKKYIEEVIVEVESSYSGPLSASYKAVVFIGTYVFWSMYSNS